jgi:hypothetical protein
VEFGLSLGEKLKDFKKRAINIIITSSLVIVLFGLWLIKTELILFEVLKPNPKECVQYEMCRDTNLALKEIQKSCLKDNTMCEMHAKECHKPVICK